MIILFSKERTLNPNTYIVYNTNIMKKTITIVVTTVVVLGVGAWMLMGINSRTTGPAETPGEAVRLAGVDAALSQIAKLQNVDAGKVSLVSVSDQEWPDACLGLATEGEMCAQMITPGYEIKAMINGVQYTYRSNKDGGVVRLQK